MNSLPLPPWRSAKLLAMLGIGLLPSLPVLAQKPNQPPNPPIPPTEQSPVAISNSSTVPNPNPPQIDFNYGIVNVMLNNTYGKVDETATPYGRFLAREWGTLKATFPEGSAPEILVNGIPYDLIQFHFHVPAEHTVNGKRAAMEVHFVHLIHNGQGAEAACMSSNRPLVVLGAFIDVGNSNTELQRIFPPGLPQTSYDPTVNVPNVDLRALLPSGTPIWEYEGGLTAPADDCPNFAPLSTQAVTGDFPEAVQWFLYNQKIQLPQALIDRFSALFPDGDARSLKALINRQILSNKNGN